MLQRTFDIIISSIVIVLLMPLLILVCIVLRFSGEGEIIYKQKRVGRLKQEFEIYKFATMLKNSPNLGSGNVTIKDDPRVLPFGRWLRATKINELPQLFNILFGQMSFVGPRPLTADNWNYYTVEQQNIISSLRPGLTGVGSIYFRNEEKYLDNAQDPLYVYRNIIAPKKAECEIWYFHRNSIVVYFFIIILTAFSVVFKKSEFPQRVVNKLIGHDTGNIAN